MDPDWIGRYLEEDLGPGDVTSESVFAPGDRGAARIVAREPGLVAGLAHAEEVFRRLNAEARARVTDGGTVAAGQVLLEVHGPARGLLSAERVALNILGRMSGIATAVRAIQDRLGPDCRVAGTRKTTPGFRAFEKEAIAVGGGDPHRRGLWDEAMVKDNHAAAAGGLAKAVAAVRQRHPGLVVTAEAEGLEDALAAAQAGADWILIDNQDPATGAAWAQRLRAAHPAVRIEASGGVRPESVADHAYADRVSLGALTQEARALDVSMEWLVPEAPA